MDEGVTIPVSIDAIRLVDDQRMARATYWIVASVAPIPGWSFALRDDRQLLVLGEVGVVYSANAPGGEFSADDLTDLFDRIEEDLSLSIETEDLWIPLMWLEPSREPERGDVYRVPLEAFQAAYRYRADAITTADLMEAAPEGSVAHSAGETEAFGVWARAQIDEAKQTYPKDPDLALTWREA